MNQKDFSLVSDAIVRLLPHVGEECILRAVLDGFEKSECSTPALLAPLRKLIADHFYSESK